MKKGVSVLLIILLVCLIGGLGFFSYKLLFQEDKIIVPDFTDKTREEITTWCASLKTNPCSFDNDYSDTVAEGKLIYQSIAADQELGDSISFIISLGKKVEIKLPTIDLNTTKETLDKWKADNNIPNLIEYVEQHNNDVEEGKIIKVEPLVLTNTTDVIKVYISKGKDEDKDSAEIVITSGAYLDLKVDEFEKKVKALGLVPNHNTDRDNKSSKVEKGNIVWHGSGTYVKGETINYGICTEKTEGKIVEVKAKEYIGKTLDEFKKICENLGLTPVHSETYKDEYSDTIAKGSLDWHGYGSYDTSDEDDRVIHYTLSLGKESEDTEDYSLPKYISKYDYQGKTLDEFKTIASKFGFEARHREDWDDYSDTVKKGYILRNGDSTYYEEDTYISYGLSLGKKDGSSTSTYFEIKSGQFKGLTLDEFKTKVKELGLTAEKSQVHEDDYSETVAKGCILWHGAATDFKAGEIIHYSLSLGKKSETSDNPSPVTKTISISSNQYINKSESEFKTIISGLGLTTNHNQSKDEYSSKDVGTVIWHASGEFSEGSTVTYGLSKGIEYKHLNSYSLVIGQCEAYNNSYEDTAKKSVQYFNSQGFTNITCVGAKGDSSIESIGIVISITIDGKPYAAGDYPVNVPIVVTISNDIIR